MAAETKFVVTAQTDGATQKLTDVADATEKITTASEAAGDAQAALAKQTAVTTKAVEAETAAATKAAQAQQTHTMTVRAFGAGSREAAESGRRLAAAESALSAASKTAKQEADALARGIAGVKSESDKASPALAKVEKAAARLGKQSEQTAHQHRMLELSMRSNSNAAQKAGGGFDLLGAAGGKLMGVLGPAALAGTLVSAAGFLVDAADASLRYDTALRNLPFSIEAAQRASMGLIDETTLIVSASQGVSLGVTKTADDFATLAEASTKLALKLNQPADQLLNNLITALGRGSTELLDNAGIVMKASQAQERYAASIGKTVKTLTDAEKADAFKVEAMKAIKKAADEVTVSMDSTAAQLSRYKVVALDAWEATKRLAVEGFGFMLNPIGYVSTALGKASDNMKMAAEAASLAADPRGPMVALEERLVGIAGTAGQATRTLAEMTLSVEGLARFEDQQYKDKAQGYKKTEAQQRDAWMSQRRTEDAQRESDAKARETFWKNEAAKDAARLAKSAGKGKAAPTELDIVKKYQPNEAAPDLIGDWMKEEADAQAKAFAQEVQTRQARIDAIHREIEVRQIAGQETADLYAKAEAQEAQLTKRLREEARDQAQIDAAKTRTEQAQHTKRMRQATAAAAARQAEEEKRQARMQILAGHVESLGSTIVQAAEDEANGTKGAVAKGLEAWLKGIRNQMIVKALVETALGVANAAAYNYPGAAAHFSAAGLAGAAAVAAGVAGAAVGAGIDSAGVRGGGAAKGGGAAGGGGSLGGDSSRPSRDPDAPKRGGNEYQQVPVSYEHARRGADMPAIRQETAAGGDTINVYVTGLATKADIGQSVSKALRTGARAGKRR